MHSLGCYGGVCRYKRTRNLYVSLYFFFFLFSSSVSTLCRIAFRDATKSYAVYYEQQWLGAKQSHFHTSNRVPASVAERAWWLTKFQSLLLNIWLTLCQWIPGLAPFYFLPLRDERHKAYHICVLHFRDRRGAASLHHRFRAATTILLREQKPSLVWFSWRSRSCPVSEYEHSLIEILKYSDHMRSLLCYCCLLVVFALFLLEIIPKSLI